MHNASLLLIMIVFFALLFDFINGFHDTANAIATVVSTRVLSPRSAIMMAAALNFGGALVSTQVAKTIASGLVTGATQTVVLAALLGAIVWNLITWKFGIPSSSSHALIGGLCGAAFMHGGTASIIWNGLLLKVIVPLVTSPIAGFILGFVIMKIIYVLFSHSQPGKVSHWFRRLQIVSAALMAFSHGQNDAQKSMGIITIALFSQGVIKTHDVPLWVVLACAVAMALGTSSGGWRIIRTMGHKILRLEPVHGFAAETSASIVILLAGKYGAPVSTTHVISGSIFGVGASKRLSAVRWGVAQSMLVAWVLTIPASGLIAAISYFVLHLINVR